MWFMVETMRRFFDMQTELFELTDHRNEVPPGWESLETEIGGELFNRATDQDGVIWTRIDGRWLIICNGKDHRGRVIIPKKNGEQLYARRTPDGTLLFCGRRISRWQWTF